MQNIIKKILFILLLPATFFTTGCFSSNYSVSDFNSKEDFNKNFNDFAKDNEINLTFKNKTTIPVKIGSYIVSDSLNFITNETPMSFAISDIEQINYSSLDYKQADIILKNGEKLKALNIKTSSDSIKFTAARSLPSAKTIPLNKISKASHENRWLGIWGGMGLTFAALGVLVATKVFPYTKQGNDTKETFDGGAMAFIGVPAAVIVGSIIGLIIGYNFNYYF